MPLAKAKRSELLPLLIRTVYELFALLCVGSVCVVLIKEYDHHSASPFPFLYVWTLDATKADVKEDDGIDGAFAFVSFY